MVELKITREIEKDMKKERYEQNRSVQEIARKFGVSRPTVYSHTMRSL